MSLFQAAAAMTANARWQESISQNLAAASIPGFKKNSLSFEAVQAGLMPQNISDAQMRFMLPRASLSTSFAQGELRPTGANTDVAIEGKGFFAVQMPNGDTAYSRDGEFHVSATGQITTKQGFLVLGEGGPVQLDRANPTPVTISSTGEVSQGAETRGKLKIVDFDQPQLLTQISGGLFIAGRANSVPTDVKYTTVRQGFLENSNTSPAAEMASLLMAMRAFEASQRSLQLHDERMGRAIAELGNPN